VPALRTRLPFRCASAGLCCSGARSLGGLPAAGCVGDVCRELQFHRQLEQLEFGSRLWAGRVHEQFV
jgi:hypothetical protein